jgi:hypothetical protein
MGPLSISTPLCRHRAHIIAGLRGAWFASGEHKNSGVLRAEADSLIHSHFADTSNGCLSWETGVAFWL